ncbi:D-2-hydroxyacid dehydrogenase [Eubacterium oxidoreducens]|uniref:Glycerate dehydrogenase n=1 Tax=Eubacterium oxidoreducens TaxID=1732 RepID=A0A1G6A044_EUBOX|nr:D-2-hydroxyacid dehydrogenase [Eubacterium oxidoreducens]SDB01690.1 glycerate dehydrogenase [Eubacterium oxidoreducens]
MEIVFLERNSVGDDVDLSAFEKLGNVRMYSLSKPEEIEDKIDEADIVVVNKMPMNEITLKRAKQLKLVCVTATGTNNLDKAYLEKRNIAWRNAEGYSTQSVAQHTFAMLFYLLEKLDYYDKYVKSGAYINSDLFTHMGKPFAQLSKMTWGIIGLGQIGRRVAELASAFGCKVIYYSTRGNHDDAEYMRVSFEELLRKSDIVSVHAPLNEKTQGLMNAKAFEAMKKNAIFINVGRGPIVVEEDLANALKQDEIAAAGLDVLCKEPMHRESPFAKLKDSTRLLITPHIAWAAGDARDRLMQIIHDEMKEYIESSLDE